MAQGLVPLPLLTPAVAGRMGELLPEEVSLLHGAERSAAVLTELGVGATVPGERVDELAAVLRAGRGGACRFCRLPLSGHTLEVNVGSAAVWCPTDERRNALEWLAGPPRFGALRTLGGMAYWIGLPAASLGLLSWTPALFAGMLSRRRAWLAAAATFFALTAGVLVTSPPVDEPGGAVFTALVISNWLGSMLYGAFQVRPWLAGLPRRGQGGQPRVSLR